MGLLFSRMQMTPFDLMRVLQIRQQREKGLGALILQSFTPVVNFTQGSSPT